MAKAKPRPPEGSGKAGNARAPAKPARPATGSATRGGVSGKSAKPHELKTSKNAPKSTKPAAKPVAAKGKPSRPVPSAPKAKPSKGGSSRTKGKAPARKLRYQVKQQIVYPLHGVGQILRIEQRPFLDRKLLYYIIYIEVSDMTVMVPVDRADELGIRPIVDRRESAKALKLVSDSYEPVPTDWKMRYQMNLDLLKSGSIIDIATVVRTLYHRSKIKELPILERKLYDSALRLLMDEVSLSLDKSKDEVERMVFDRLESSRGK